MVKDNRNLKKEARRLQARTGQSYMSALRDAESAYNRPPQTVITGSPGAGRAYGDLQARIQDGLKAQKELSVFQEAEKEAMSDGFAASFADFGVKVEHLRVGQWWTDGSDSNRASVIAVSIGDLHYEAEIGNGQRSLWFAIRSFDSLKSVTNGQRYSARYGDYYNIMERDPSFPLMVEARCDEGDSHDPMREISRDEIEELTSGLNPALTQIAVAMYDLHHSGLKCVWYNPIYLGSDDYDDAEVEEEEKPRRSSRRSMPDYDEEEGVGADSSRHRAPKSVITGSPGAGLSQKDSSKWTHCDRAPNR